MIQSPYLNNIQCLPNILGNLDVVMFYVTGNVCL